MPLRSALSALILTASVALPAGVAHGQSAEALVPEGCSAILTVQYKQCGTSLFWRCDAAPEGTTWEAFFDGEGLYSISLTDPGYQWIYLQSYADGSRETLKGAPADPIDIRALLSTGSDSYAFAMQELIDGASRTIRYAGHDALTDETRVIDGEPLRVLEFDIRSEAESGQEIYRGEGIQYVLEDERLFLTGIETYHQDGDSLTDDYSPVEIIRPEAPGFGATTPIYECGEILSGLTPDLAAPDWTGRA
ncbi:MAG: hypothetical protein ABNH26_03185 [Celeribacter sp.]